MTTLVTGATGNTGRHVVAELVRRGEHVRALTRDPARASFPDGVEVIAGDAHRAAWSWAPPSTASAGCTSR